MTWSELNIKFTMKENEQLIKTNLENELFNTQRMFSAVSD